MMMDRLIASIPCIIACAVCAYLAIMVSPWWLAGIAVSVMLLEPQQ